MFVTKNVEGVGATWRKGEKRKRGEKPIRAADRDHRDDIAQKNTRGVNRTSLSCGPIPRLRKHSRDERGKGKRKKRGSEVAILFQSGEKKKGAERCDSHFSPSKGGGGWGV